MWCIKEINAEYKERMYKILEVYQEEYDKRNPVIGVDEKPKQLLDDVKKPIPMEEGKSEKYDYEYKKCGKANIFVAVDFKGGKRIIEVTNRRTKKDFAKFIKRLVDKIYPNTNKIRLVLDNLNTHFKNSFYETFDKQEAERILNRVEFIYTPKHASWLNVAEIEINVMDVECIGRRIKDKKILSSEINAWVKQRNKDEKKINWRFTKEKADEKLSKYYV